MLWCICVFSSCCLLIFSSRFAVLPFLDTNNPLHYYSADSIRTSNGVLNITTSIDPKNFTVFNEKYSKYNLQYKEIKSGMLQSWNKFCYTGGIVEFSAKLPGSPSIGGLWPAIWMMGNMARATYVNSSDLVWPFSTNVCDNRTRNAQLVNSCPDSNNNAQYNMPKNRGRGAPEVDVLEMMYMDMFEHPILSSSLQVAPGVDHNRPIPGHVPNSVCALKFLTLFYSFQSDTDVKFSP